jgi:hypothetical protein
MQMRAGLKTLDEPAPSSPTEEGESEDVPATPHNDNGIMMMANPGAHPSNEEATCAHCLFPTDTFFMPVQGCTILWNTHTSSYTCPGYPHGELKTCFAYMY